MVVITPVFLTFLALAAGTVYTFDMASGVRIPNGVRRKFVIKEINMLDTENPDGDHSSHFPHTLHEHLDKVDTSSLVESEVCDYGIMTALAEEHIALGNYDEAMKLAKNAIATADHTREMNNVYAAYAEGIWGDALYSKGEYRASADHYHGALKSYERHYRSNSGPEAVELVGAINLAAWNLLSKKDYEDATAAWSTALGMTERLLGPQNTDVAGCMTNLAISHMNMGDLGAAPEALLKKALLVYENKKMDKFDMKHMREQDEPIWKIKVYLGDMYFTRGDDEQAFHYYSSVEAAYNMGDIQDVKIAKALERFGIIEWRKGHKEHAEKLLEDAMFITERKTQCVDDVEIGERLKMMLKSLRRGEIAPRVAIPARGELE